MTINPIIVQTGGGGGLSYTVNSGTVYPANVTSFTLPDDLTAIGDYAFCYKSSLEAINIPAGLTDIGSYAFQDCSSLVSIVLPAGVALIGDSAFRNCTSLKKLTVLASEPPYLASNALQGVPANCSIRVPVGSVATYKAAANWSARAAYITAI